MPEAAFLCDRDGRVRAANRIARHLFRWTEAAGLPDLSALLPGIMQLVRIERKMTRTRSRAFCLDGTVREVEVALGWLDTNQPDEGFLLTVREAWPVLSSEHESYATRPLQAVAQAAIDTGEVVDVDRWRSTVVRTLVDDFGAMAVGLWHCVRPGESPSLRAIAVAGSVAERGQPDHEDLAAIIDPDHPAWSLARLEGVVESGKAWSGEGFPDASETAFAWMARHGIRSVASQPLRRGGRLTGILVMFGPGPLDSIRSTALAAYAAVIAAAGVDIHTDQCARAARDEAEDQRRRLQTILDVLPVGVMLLEGADGRVTLVNPAARGMGGFVATESQRLDELPESLPVFHLDGRPFAPTERPLWRALRKGERVQETLRYRNPEGVESILEVAAAPFPGPSGGAVTCFREVTEEVQLRQETRERAAQLKALLDHLPVGVAYFDEYGVCRATNSPARKFLVGSSRYTINETHAADLFAETPLLRQALERCLKEGCPHQEHSAPWSDRGGAGGIRYLDWQFEPLIVSHGRYSGVLALIVDVTDRKLASDQLRQAVETAVQASRTKTQFLSAVSHDLRTPVNALRLLAEWLALVAERQPQPDPELRGLVGDVRRATGNLVDLVNDLLELTLIESGGMAYRPTRFTIQPWLDEILSPLRVSARAKGLELMWSATPAERVAYTDRVKLGRVLVNLVANAIKFTEEGRIEVSVGAGPVGELALRVCDTGPGIAAEDLERIFDEFAQLRNPERDRTKGTGLGLAICRRLVQGAGGRLLTESKLGVGSTFTALYPPDHLAEFELPTPHAPLASPLPSASEIPPRNRAEPVSGGSILLVEDDPYSRRSLARLLEREGYRVIQAESGPAVLDLLKSNEPALMILDLMLPGMDGLAVIKRSAQNPDGRPECHRPHGRPAQRTHRRTRRARCDRDSLQTPRTQRTPHRSPKLPGPSRRREPLLLNPKSARYFFPPSGLNPMEAEQAGTHAGHPLDRPGRVRSSPPRFQTEINPCAFSNGSRPASAWPVRSAAVSPQPSPPPTPDNPHATRS